MQVRLVLRSYLILNRIQIFCLFKEIFSKALYIRISVALMPPKSPHASPSLFSLLIPTPKGWASSISMPKRSLGIPLCLLVFRLWLLYNQEKESKRRRKEKDQGKDQRVDHDPSFVQIRRMIVLREKRSTPKKTVLS